MNIRKLIAVAVIATSAAIQMAASADTVEINGVTWTYTVNNAANRTVTLGDGTNPAMPKGATLDAADIPWTFTNNGTSYTVTALAANAFSGCTALTGTLAIPASVTSIGAAVFSGCSGLVGVSSFGDGCTAQWGQQVFRYCKGLRGTLVVPDSNPCSERHGFLGISPVIQARAALL